MVCVLLHIGHTFSSGSVADIRVSKQNFDDAFKKVRPSVSKKVRKYEQYSSCCASFKTLIDLLTVELDSWSNLWAFTGTSDVATVIPTLHFHPLS